MVSGLGDLYLTCSSNMSRNFRFGQLLSTGMSGVEAEKEIGMVVEGAHTCTAAKELASRHHVPMPIVDTVSNILEGKTPVAEAVLLLMKRQIKDEHL